MQQTLEFSPMSINSWLQSNWVCGFNFHILEFLGTHHFSTTAQNWFFFWSSEAPVLTHMHIHLSDFGGVPGTVWKRSPFLSRSFILLTIKHWMYLNLDSCNLPFKNWSRGMLKVALATCAQNWHNICFQAVKTNVVMFTMFIRFGTPTLSLPAHVRLALKSSV